MSASHRIVNVVASSSRPLRCLGGPRLPLSITRAKHSAAVPSPIVDFDPPPILNKGKRREDIRYDIGGAGQSNERLAFSQKPNGADKEELGADWGIDGSEEVPEGLEPGRVIEARRNGQTTLGLILSAIVLAGRPRLLVLVLSGEIWPVSPQDIQFTMPASLVSPAIARECWSPQMLEAWRNGSEVIIEPNGPMSEARRTAVRVMRKVSKETEKMSGRLLGPSAAGGIETVWEHWVEEGRTSITAAEAAEFMLNKDGHGIKVKKNTLSAYTAHTLLMDRPDLFVSDTGDMWKSGLFLVRARADRERLNAVEGWFNGTIPGGKAIVDAFTTKARAAVTFSTSVKRHGDIRETDHNLPQWTSEELDVIAVLLARLYEVRSTQIPPTTALSYLIMKAVNAYPGDQVDQPLVKRFLIDIGMLSPHDSLERARSRETTRRTLALHNMSGRVLGSNDLLTGTELDGLREDFTGQTVYVIDDASASELDDGISIEHATNGEYWVHVHVADPTSYLRPEHPISVRASAQGSSLYTPEGVVPLIPLDVTMEKLSLGASKDKQNVMTFSALVTSDGSIKDERVSMGWIKSPRVVTYASVNEVLGLSDGGPSTRPFGTPSNLEASLSKKAAAGSADAENLRLLHGFAIRHRQRRYATSGLEWSLTSGSIKLLSDIPSMSSDAYSVDSLSKRSRIYSGEPTIDYSVPGGGQSGLNAQAMVAECMILAGQIGASFCHRHGIAAPFRGSGPPKVVGQGDKSPSVVLEELLSSRNEMAAVDPFRMKKFDIYLPPGEISPTMIPHWVMGITDPNTGYVRATSPLRRYDDLLVHWQIKAHLASMRGIKAPWSLMTGDQVLDLSQRSDQATKRNKRAGVNAEAWWLTRLVRSRLLESPEEGRYRTTADTVDLHEPLEARVAGAYRVQKNGTTWNQVWIPKLGTSAEMEAPNSVNLSVGETILTRVKSAELEPVPYIYTTLVQ